MIVSGVSSPRRIIGLPSSGQAVRSLFCSVSQIGWPFAWHSRRFEFRLTDSSSLKVIKTTLMVFLSYRLSRIGIITCASSSVRGEPVNTIPVSPAAAVCTASSTHFSTIFESTNSPACFRAICSCINGLFGSAWANLSLIISEVLISVRRNSRANNSACVSLPDPGGPTIIAAHFFSLVIDKFYHLHKKKTAVAFGDRWDHAPSLPLDIPQIFKNPKHQIELLAFDRDRGVSEHRSEPY